MFTKNIQHISILVLCSLLAGIGNYLYYPLSGYFLSLGDFSVFMSLLSIFNILGFVTLGFSLYINKIVGEHKGDDTNIADIFYSFLSLFFGLSVFIFLLIVLFSGYIADFIHISSKLPVIYTSLGIITGFLLVVIEGVARGKHYFNFLGINYIINAFAKLALGALFFILGYHLYGALSGLVLGSSIALLYGFLYLKNKLPQRTHTYTLSHLITDIKKQYKSIIGFSIVSLYIGTLMNIDIILARNIFSEIDSGIYASIAVLGKFALFLLLSIETVYYSKIVQSKTKSLIDISIASILIIGSFSLMIGISFLFGPSILAVLNFPEIYLGLFIGILGFYGLLTLASLLLKILLLLSQRYIVLFIGASAIAGIYYIYNSATTGLSDFVFSLNIIMGIVVLCLIGRILLFFNMKKYV